MELLRRPDGVDERGKQAEDDADHRAKSTKHVENEEDKPAASLQVALSPQSQAVIGPEREHAPAYHYNAEVNKEFWAAQGCEVSFVNGAADSPLLLVLVIDDLPLEVYLLLSFLLVCFGTRNHSCIEGV